MTRFGRYELIRMVAKGGMGAVYEARDPALQRRVAIKTIPLSTAEDAERVRERLHEEARLAAVLNHPNIIHIYDVGEHENVAFIVMEFVSGETLQSVLARTKTADWMSLAPVLRHCARALDFAHRRGIVHGDMKPSNVIVQADGVPKILDFGLAHLAYQGRDAQSAGLVGTPLYVPPERLRGAPSHPASDQYSLAVIVYRLSTGRYPFRGDTAYETLRQILNDVPPPPDELNRALSFTAARAIERALSKEPEARFATCAELLNSVLGDADEAVADSAASPSDRVPFGSPLREPNEPTASLPAPSRPRLADAQSRFWTRLRHLWSRGEAEHVSNRSIESSSDLGQESTADEGQTIILGRPIHARIPRRKLAHRQTEELIACARADAFERVVALEGRWLPGVDAGNSKLLAFREAARYLVAAGQASSTHIGIEHLTRAEHILDSLGASLLDDQSPDAAEFPRALDIWKQITRARLAASRARLASELPNPFRPGQPLRPDLGRLMFRGRDEIVRHIESILVQAESESIALLGPRRCGKTSLLQMLPVLIPQSVCIFFDLQDNPVDSPRAFFEALARQTCDQARRDRRLELPPLGDGGVFSSAGEWLLALDRIESDFRILICFDEFERLEELFPGDRKDLLQLMGLLRATIQHRRKLRLLVSGVAPFDELGQIWNDHFINLRQIRVGHLDRDTAVELLEHPTPDFPPDAVPDPVAVQIFERTGGQPYLLQLYGSLLVGRLNAEGRRCSTVADVAFVEDEALTQGAYYFRHTYEAAPTSAKEALEALARGEHPDTSPGTRLWLKRRGLVNDNDDLAIPVLGSFLLAELGIP